MKIKTRQPVLSLRPTQFSIGLLEVEYKVLELRKLDPEALLRTIEKTRIPVVVAPWRDLYIIDHHHHLFACWHADILQARIEVVEDYADAKLSYKQFWRRMVKHQRAYLYDQFGEGPREPLYLPPDIRGMADDPYRSLAWLVRKEGGYENSNQTFAEFQWANHFRARKLLVDHGREGFHDAVKKGLRLARLPAAQDLPGFHGHKKKKRPEKPGDEFTKSKFVPKHRTKGDMATVPVIKG